jgi:hypothetical protein
MLVLQINLRHPGLCGNKAPARLASRKYYGWFGAKVESSASAWLISPEWIIVCALASAKRGSSTVPENMLVASFIRLFKSGYTKLEYRR